MPRLRSGLSPDARSPQAPGLPREQLLSFLSASGLGSAQQRPGRIPAATVLPPPVLVVLEGRYFFM